MTISLLLSSVSVLLDGHNGGVMRSFAVNEMLFPSVVVTDEEREKKFLLVVFRFTGPNQGNL